MPASPKYDIPKDSLRADLAADMSFREIAAKHGVSYGVIRYRALTLDFDSEPENTIERGIGGDALFAKLLDGRAFRSATVTPTRYLASNHSPLSIHGSLSGCAADMCAG